MRRYRAGERPEIITDQCRNQRPANDLRSQTPQKESMITPPTHILKYSLNNHELTCRIRCGDTIGDIMTSEASVAIVQHRRGSERKGRFIFHGSDAMRRAIQACWNPEMKAILTLADSLNH